VKTDPCDELASVLVQATVALARAGRPAEANRLAGRGYAAVRRTRPEAAQRLNRAMHGLARMLDASTRIPEEPTVSTTTPLDVRTEPPARRHSLIFDTFDGLAVDNAFELINDHDPKPLYYQLEAEQTGRFSWEYLEQGPEVWRVRIGRTS
jgi:uncharacterized protein (DUF2249 family)